MKEWVRAAKPVNGPTVVTVTLVEGFLTAKWSVKAYGKVKEAVIEARRHATVLLDELREATDD